MSGQDGTRLECDKFSVFTTTQSVGKIRKVGWETRAPCLFPNKNIFVFANFKKYPFLKKFVLRL